jgi:hypothetical protein
VKISASEEPIATGFSHLLKDQKRSILILGEDPGVETRAPIACVTGQIVIEDGTITCELGNARVSAVRGASRTGGALGSLAADR